MIDRVGAGTTYAIYTVCILVFALRLTGRPRAAHRVGAALFLTLPVLAWLFARGLTLDRAPLFFVQLSLFAAFLLVEFLLDFWPRVAFRADRRIVVPYVTLFFAGTGGMLGVAAHAGSAVVTSSAVLFLAMGVLAFIQRGKTGL